MFGRRPKATGDTVVPPASAPPEAAPAEAPRGGMFARLRERLDKTRRALVDGIGNLLLGRKQIDEGVLEELETALLVADVGVTTTQRVVGALTARVRRKELADADALFATLADELTATLAPSARPFAVGPARPFVILVVGVNGAGKTTTIGKLAALFQQQGLRVLLAAGDTFRAAAVEQLQAWGQRLGVPVAAQAQGADAASVIFDALSSARARGIDVVIADTAGRLHNKSHLMAELAKIGRVMARFDATAPHETWLVLDAGIGQNALAQAREFAQAVPLSGLVLTKLDGTARGGVVFAVSEATQLPIRYVGVGEGLDDLRPFVATDFVAALLSRERA
jgi:fused signal recognition particle receptor